MNSQRASTKQRRERAELEVRFGKIGISAVAAAMRYGSDARNPAYALPSFPTNRLTGPGPTKRCVWRARRAVIISWVDACAPAR